MKTTAKFSHAALVAAGVILFGGSAIAGELNPKSSTPNLEYGDVLKIRLPYGMCEFEKTVPAYVVEQMRTRRDWERLLEYMLANCPELGLPLADTATASISAAAPDGGDGGDGSSGGTGGTGGGETGGTGGETGGGETGGDGTGGETGTSDDSDRGHGNDADGHDEDNPGNKS